MAETWEEAKNLLAGVNLKEELDKVITITDHTHNTLDARDKYIGEIIRLAIIAVKLYPFKRTGTGFFSEKNYNYYNFKKYKILLELSDRDKTQFIIKYKSSTILDVIFYVDKPGIVEVDKIKKIRYDKFDLLKEFSDSIKKEMDNINSFTK